MDYTLPGSWLLQAWFYGLAAAILVAASLLVGRSARVFGDAPGEAARRSRRFQMAAASWVTIVSAASYSGVLNPLAGPPWPFGLMFGSIVVLGVVIARSATGTRLARGLPLSVLVGFQAFRLPLEVSMHQAYVEGLMPVQMSYSGRNFDILTGATALVLGAVLAYRRLPRWVTYAWNVLGLALLANIVSVALLSTPMIAYFGPDRLNVWVARMPYTLLPAVMVLAAWAGHLIVFRALKESQEQT